MNTAKKIYESDADGIVHVDVPVNRPGQRVEVTVVWAEVEAAQPEMHPSEDWSDLYGILKDDPIERGPQGEYETRLPLK